MLAAIPPYQFILLGLGAGVLAGFFGVGGGLIIVPALVLLFGFSQSMSSGTSLVALLLPVGILGVWNYYSAGKITMDNVKAGLMISAGMFFGTYIGSKFAVLLPEIILKRAFCIFLIFAAVRMWFSVPKV